MRLIDGDALINEVMERYCSDCERRKGIKNGKWKIVYSIGDAPCRACGTGDMISELEDAPIIGERKTGSWFFEEYPDGYYHWECSECGSYFNENCKEWKYCPNCGAKMEEKDAVD